MHEFPQFSGGCRDWIDWLIHDQNLEIQSAFHGGEKKIGPYKVDGFCSNLNTVFEFYGDYWHCHPDQFPNENVVHPTVKGKDDNPMTVKDIRARDQQRVRDLQDKGYTVEIIWEKDWQALINQRPEIKVYLKQHRTHTHFKKYLNQNQIIQYIQDGRLFGFVECDIEVPDHLKDYFSEMTPTRIQMFLLKMLVNICKNMPKSTKLRIFLVASSLDLTLVRKLIFRHPC